ncbi:MAG TPA: hypothetical protein VJX67_26290 [Blastocatellia bacterium]|nr:hypothetical protein [Blastocatellia bacterium]
MKTKEFQRRKASQTWLSVGRMAILGTLIVLLSQSSASLAYSGSHDADKTDAGAATKSDGNSGASDKASPSATAPGARGDKKDTDSSSPKNGSTSTDEQIFLLNQKVNALEDLVKQQQKMMEEMQSRMKAGSPTTVAPAVTTTDAPAADSAAGVPVAAAAAVAGPASGAAPASNGNMKPSRAAQDEESPLQFRIGTAKITPVGFMDFTTVFRTTNAGSGIGTNFGSIPFNNSAAGNLTEFRFSAQNSRVGLRVDADVAGSHVLGYLESDFLGAVPGNVEVTSNSNPMRMRLYWVDVRKDKLEILGGQSWSMLTPGRNGISALPGDLFYTQNMDVNYQNGLTWARQTQFRLLYHPSDTVALGLSLENPEQYIGGSGGGGLVILPTNLATPYATQLDNGGNGTAVPNLHPDIIAKAAFDPKVGDLHFHVEFGALLSSFKLYNPTTKNTFTTTGGGGQVNFNLEIFKNFHFISNNYYSDGGGRYIFGLAPDLVVRGDGSASLIHAASTVTGFEANASKNVLVYGYYGGTYIQRNRVIDPANGALVGYGFPGSPTSQDRNIQEATFGINPTIWKDAKYGALQLITQYSYLIRHPWAVPTGSPSDAHTHMFFIDLRYVLPGSAPKVGK